MTGAPPTRGAAPRPLGRMAGIGRHGVIYAIGMLASKAVAFVMLPLYTRFLTPSDYGVLQLITMTIEVVSIVAGSRIAHGIFRFYHKADTDQGRQRVLATSLVLLTITYAFASLLLFAFAPAVAEAVFGGNGRYALYVRLAAGSLLFETLVLVPTSYIQLRERSKLFVGVQLGKLLLQLVLNVILLIPFGLGVLGVLISSLVSNIVVGLFLTGMLVRDVGVGLHGPTARDLLRFGIPLVGTQVATFFVTFGDRYFLNRADDTAAVGLYGLAYQFAFMLMAIGYLPFNRIWEPTRFAIADKPDRDVTYARAFIYMNIVLLSVAVVICLYAHDFIRIVAEQSFHPATPLIPVLVAAYVFQAWMVFHNLGIFVTEQTTYYTAANWIAAGLAFVGFVWLIPALLAWGAALTTLVVFVVRWVIVYLASQRLWPVRYRWGPVLRIGLMAIIVVLTAMVVSVQGLLASLAFRTALMGGFLAGIWFGGVFSANERLQLTRSLRAPRKLLSTLRA